MEDEDKNSKSLVRITRVGSTPTTGIPEAHDCTFSCAVVGFFAVHAPGAGAAAHSHFHSH